MRAHGGEGTERSGGEGAVTRQADTPAADPPVSTRVLTLPNGLSTLRLLGVPLFLYLVLGPHADLAAFGVLAVGSFTDWLDGRLARAWNQVTRIGQLLDPVADRLYIVATVAALAIRGILPWWLAVALLARDVVLAVTLPVLRHHGHGPLPVHFLGKAATFNLLYAFPLLLLGAVDGAVGTVAAPIGWAFTGWGAALYWWAALLYLAQCAVLVRAARADRAASTGVAGAGP